MRRFRRRQLVPDPTPTQERQLLSEIYLYVNWKYVTRQLTTTEKELWADAIDENTAFWGDAETRVPRWWRNDYQEEE